MESEEASNDRGDYMSSEGTVEDTHAENSETEVDKQSRSQADENSDLLPDEKLPQEPLNDQERHLLYEKGIKFKKKGNLRHALYCLLACVRGLKDGSHFQQLPECLHNIADIYSQLGDYENAVSFAQAEKLYYETSLISAGSMVQQEQDGSDSVSSTSPSDQTTGNTTRTTEAQHAVKDDPKEQTAEARSANEYEKLAHMCLKQKDAQLALEYCGKAVKLRQSIYGEEHPVTKKTLDLFTVIYAEMGKEQYTAAMQKFNEAKQATDATAEEEEKTAETAEAKKDDLAENNETSVDETSTSAEELHDRGQGTVTPAAKGGDEKVSLSPGQAMFFFFLITAAVAVCVTLFVCHISGTDPGTTFKYIMTRLRFYYYYYVRRAPAGNSYF
ncbi:uncharacterized protein LOC113668381 isoform X1 [Pocillopora damicornis]|uniref:uncharacterized protein LOC113668381 isoform X1 n=1 Tax=Pocillopora damicornis TaxID=46731 RepID=UPI000F551CCC|nr:uncharacterized protein LOC113668381 isoform X1 [Pocillopora damicornis]